jgi:hypothetical protein
VKTFLILILIASASFADVLKKDTLACPSVELLQKAPLDDYINTNLYAMANNCMILNKKDKVEAIGYDNLNSKEIYQKILHKKTNTYLYILRSSIEVEQGGKKGFIRF